LDLANQVSQQHRSALLTRSYLFRDAAWFSQGNVIAGR
jgi:hypothetical protein